MPCFFIGLEINLYCSYISSSFRPLVLIVLDANKSKSSTEF